MIPYVICNPKNLIPNPVYRNKSAGPRVLSKLAVELKKRGAEAFLSDEITEKQIVEIMEAGGIAVYHENQPVNAFRSSRCVGYVLGEWNVPRFNNFCDEVFFYHAALGEGSRMTISVLERDLFNDKNLPEKKYNTLYGGKGDILGFIGLNVENQKYITLDSPSKREDVAKLLRESICVYSVDHASLLFDEARLCGTPVVYIPSSFSNWERALKINKSKMGGFGLTYDEALATLTEFKEQYDEFFNVEREVKEIDAFFETTQKMEAKCPTL